MTTTTVLSTIISNVRIARIIAEQHRRRAEGMANIKMHYTSNAAGR